MADKAILVIGSDTEVAQYIEWTLKSEDYLVFTAATEELAIATAGKVRPSLILIDPATAGAGGLEICKTLHAMNELFTVPIIALSSPEANLDSLHLSDYGITGLLMEPFTREELIQKAEGALSTAVPDRRPEGASQEDRKSPESREETADPDRIEVRLNERMEGDEDEPRLEKPGIAVELLEKEESPGAKEKMGGEDGRPFVTGRRSQSRKFPVSIAALIILILLGAAGFVVYKKGFLGGTTAKTPSAFKPAAPVQKEPAPESPVPLLRPEQGIVQERPLVEPAPPAVAADQKSEKLRTVYSVQVGAFKSEKNAETLANQLKEKGYDAFTKPAQRGGETVHRVLIGRFDDRKEAGKLAVAVRDAESLKVVVTAD